MLPTGAAAKKYITETTKLMNGWTNNLPLKDIDFKAAIDIMPSLLLQKPSKTSKAKDHLEAWREELIYGARERLTSFYLKERLQLRLHHINTPKKASVNCLRSLLY